MTHVNGARGERGDGRGRYELVDNCEKTIAQPDCVDGARSQLVESLVDRISRRC